MSALPDPLVPAEVDLRDFAFMPLDVLRLRDSDLACVEDPEQFRAAVLSWCVAWHQTPAGSLPDDDTLLARLLGYGRDVKTWKKLRAAGGLRGWVKCSDDRLYHPVVAEKALDAWRGKLLQRWRTECARVKKHNQRHDLTGSRAVTVPDFDEWVSLGCPQGQALNVPATVPRETPSKGQGEGQGEGQGQGDTKEEPTGSSPPTPVAVDPSPTAAVCIALKAAGIANCNPSHPLLRTLVEAGATVDEFVAAARQAAGKSNGFAYVLAVVRGERERAAQAGGTVHRGPLAVVNRQEAVEQRNRAVADDWLAQMEAHDAAQ